MRIIALYKLRYGKVEVPSTRMHNMRIDQSVSTSSRMVINSGARGEQLPMLYVVWYSMQTGIVCGRRKRPTSHGIRNGLLVDMI